MQTNEELTISRGVARVGWIADRMQLSAQIQEARNAARSAHGRTAFCSATLL